MKHPDYPDIDFKPAIARYDYDQTYDVLEFVYLPQGFSSLIDLCGIPAFELMAIDRITPYKYLWAETYSQIVYYFLKRFNFSPHNAINERLLKDEDNNWITIPAFELNNIQVYDYSPILANFSEGKYQITGLIYQGYQEGLSGSIPTINQAFTELNLSENTEIDLNKIIWYQWLKDGDSDLENVNKFCRNSLVISKLVNGNWQDYTPSFTNKPEYLLYSDSAQQFLKIETQLVNYFESYENYYFPLQSGYKSFEAEAEVFFSVIRSYMIIITNKNISSHTVKYQHFGLLTNFCYLAIANNNKWSTKANYSDLGNVNLNIKNFYQLEQSQLNSNKHSILFGDVSANSQITWYLPSTVSAFYDTYAPFFVKKIIRNSIGVYLWKSPTNHTEFVKEKDIVEKNLESQQWTRIDLVKTSFGGGEVTIPFEESFTGEISYEVEYFSYEEFLNFLNLNSMSDQEYLDYLLQLKEQYEEDSKLW